MYLHTYIHIDLYHEHTAHWSYTYMYVDLCSLDSIFQITAAIYHELYHLNITNSIIQTSRTLSSQYHELYHLNITNSIIQTSRTLSSQ